MTEHVLPYDRSIVPQETPWDCGPAATQVVLNTRGVIQSEHDLIARIGTTVNGTDYVGLCERALDELLPDANYTSVYIENDPPTQEQKEALWANIVRSINAGYGVVMNWVSPPGNHPVAVKGSAGPNYGGGTIFHYVACMGYDDDPQLPALWIADSGFSPFGYWVSFDQAARLIPPKGYCYADLAPAEPEPEPDPEPGPDPAPPPGPAVPVGPVDTLFADVSEWQAPLDDSYPYGGIAIRVSDGDYIDKKFAANYALVRQWLDSGRLKFALLYTYARPLTWESNAAAVRSTIDENGGLHPRASIELDVERGDGNPSTDQSEALNALHANLSDYAGSPARVVSYANAPDENSMWPNRPRGLRTRGAGYPDDPFLPGEYAHQYTDGSGFGAQVGLPDSCPPFGNCDMNIAKGLSAEDVADLIGIGKPSSPTTNIGGPLDALTPEQQHQLLDDVQWMREQMDVSRPDWPADADLGADSRGLPNNLRTAVASIGRQVAALTAAVAALTSNKK